MVAHVGPASIAVAEPRCADVQRTRFLKAPELRSTTLSMGVCVAAPRPSPRRTPENGEPRWDSCGVQRQGASDAMATVQDVVCGMKLDSQRAAETTQYLGQTFYFCSLGCKNQFERDPQRYTGDAGERVHGQDA